MSAALAIAGIAAGSSLIGGFGSNRAAKRAAKRAARMQREAARLIIARSEENALLELDAGKRLTGTQTSQFAKAGIDVGGLSPLMVQAETLFQSQQNAFRIKEEGKIEAMNLRAQASSMMKGAREAARAGNISAIGQSIGIGLGTFAAAGGTFAKPGGPPGGGFAPGPSSTGAPIFNIDPNVYA